MSKLRNFIPLVTLFLLTACPLPDVSQYAQLTLEMNKAVKKSTKGVYDFLNDAKASFIPDEEEIDPAILEDLERLSSSGSQKDTTDNNKVDLHKMLQENTKEIHKTLDALVAYSDALVGIKNSGSRGKEAFNSLAVSLNSLLIAGGIPPVSQAPVAIGKKIYGAIARIRAANRMEDVIGNADTVIQFISLRLDTALASYLVVNNVARSQYLIATSDSRESQQKTEFYESLIKKEEKIRIRITLLNDYENGDYESLAYFLYGDIFSLSKLHIGELTNEIKEIYNTGGLTPQDQIDKISKLAKGKYKDQINREILLPHINEKLDLAERRAQIQNEYEFISSELQRIKKEIDQINKTRKYINDTFTKNTELLETNRELIKSWAGYHGKMSKFLKNKQSPGFNELRLYISEANELYKELVEIKNSK